MHARLRADPRRTRALYGAGICALGSGRRLCGLDRGGPGRSVDVDRLAVKAGNGAGTPPIRDRRRRVDDEPAGRPHQQPPVDLGSDEEDCEVLFACVNASMNMIMFVKCVLCISVFIYLVPSQGL